MVDHSFGRNRQTMPEPTEAEGKQLARMLSDGQLFPVLNDTKWAELRSEMLGAPQEQAPCFRARSVFAPEGVHSNWDGEFFYHLHPVAELEWVELRATSDEWLRSVLKRNNIPFSFEGGYVRVWGYTRPGPQPNWQ